MDIKRKKKEKRIQLIGGLIGICVAVVSLFYFFHAEKAEAEKRMVEIVNYVKVQCSTYTHYNESSESKSLLRAIESARQMSTNIAIETENGGQLSEDFLKENLQTLWVDGIIVLDTEGKTDHILTLPPVPEKMHRVSLLFIIIHLRNLPGTIL